MAIDAQSIASIGQNAPDIAGSTMKAYTLADAIDRRQLNQMTLQSTREEQADLSKIKTLSQQYDISNPEQRHELASRVQKEVGGKYAMDFMRMADEQDRRSAELSAAQMQNYQAKHEVMTNAIMPMYQQIQAATQQGMPPGQIEAQLLPAFKQTLDTLMKQTLPNGEKVLNQQDIQQISTMLSGQPGALLSGINSAMASSRTAQEFFATQRKEARDEANVQSEIAARKRTGENQASELDIRKRELALRELRDAELRAGGLSDEAVGSLSDQIVAGGKSRDVLANLGRGAQGATDIRKVQNEVARKMKENGMSANDILAKQQEVAGAAKEVQQAAIIASKVNYAEQEIARLAPKVLELSAKVPRSSFVPLNKLLQMKDSAISDPDLKRFKAFNQTLLNAYDMLGARGGSDVGKREANHQALVTSDSAEAYEAAVGAIVQEGAISTEAGAESMKSPLRTSTPGPASPTAAPSPAATGGAGGGTKRWEMKNGKLVLVQ